MREELKKISDEEKVMLFNAALEASENEEIDFNEAYKIALDSLLESKAEKNVTESSIRIDVPDPLQTGEVVGTVGRKVSLEPDYTLTPELYYELIRDVQERKSDAINRSNELLHNNGYPGYGYNYYFHELDGRVIDPDVFYKSSFTNVNNVDRDNLLNELKSINEAARESSYIFLRCISDEAMEEEKKDTLTYYTSLLKKLEDRDKFNLVQTQATITFEDVLKNNYDNRGLSRVGGKIAVGYDDIYDSANTFVINSSISDRSNDAGLYEEMLDAVKKRLQEIEGMSPSQYRDYRIGLMRLSSEEIKKFNDEISMYKFRKEEVQEASPMIK